MKTKIKLMTGMIGMIILSMAGIMLLSSFRVSSENGKASLAMDIRTYLDKNVKPIMQPQRKKLDQVLTAEERKQVDELNTRLRALILKRKSAGIGFIGSGDILSGDMPDFSERQKADMKASRNEMRRIITQAWAIADRHATDIDRLMGEKKSFFGTWERGITSIITDYLDDRFYFIGRKQIIKKIKNREIVQYYLPVAFLLWDPQQRILPDELIK